MKSFDQLTQHGQIRRYHRMAQEALKHYSLKVKRIHCLTIRYNVIFRVDAEEGVFALRISGTNHRTPLQIRSEMQWVEAICNNTELKMACPMRTKDNDLMVTVSVDGIPEPRHVVVMGWLYGKLLRENPTTESLRLLGQAAAKLHNQSVSYQPSGEFMTYDYDGVAEWGNLDYLEGEHPIVTPAQQALFRKAIATVEVTFARMRNEKERLYLIHTDIHLSNSILYRGEVALFDFDDCRWGLLVQDLAPALYWLNLRPDLYEAYLLGYTDIRALPCTEQQLLIALNHRAMISVNFLLHFRAHFGVERLQGYIDQAEAQIRKSL